MFRLMYSIGTRNSHTLFLQGQSAGTTNLGEYLSEALKINSTLTQLDLSGTQYNSIRITNIYSIINDDL